MGTITRVAKFCLLFIAILDFTFSVTLVDIAVSQSFREYQTYMFLYLCPIFSLTVSLTYWTGSKSTKKEVAIAIALGLTCLILTLISGFIDVLYLTLEPPFPDQNTQWTWTYQYEIFGNWNTNLHLAWMGFWVFLVTPLMWYHVARVIKGETLVEDFDKEIERTKE